MATDRAGRWTPIIWARKSCVTRKGRSSTRSSTWSSQRAARWSRRWIRLQRISWAIVTMTTWVCRCRSETSLPSRPSSSRSTCDRNRMAVSGTCTMVRIGIWSVPRQIGRPVMPSRPIMAVSTVSPPSSMATIEATPLVGKYTNSISSLAPSSSVGRGRRTGSSAGAIRLNWRSARARSRWFSRGSTSRAFAPVSSLMAGRLLTYVR